MFRVILDQFYELGYCGMGLACQNTSKLYIICDWRQHLLTSKFFAASADLAFDRHYTQSLQQAFSRITNELNNAIEASGCFVYTVGDDQSFTPLVTGGPITDAEQALFLSKVIYPETDVLAYRVTARPTTLFSNHVQSDQRMTPSILTELEAAAAVAVPVLSEEELIGLLLIVRRGDKINDFTPAEIRLAEWFATAIALALENGRLYIKAQKRLSESRALHQVTLALLQKLELNEVLQIICDEAQRMTYSSGSAIALVESEDWLRVMYCAGETPEKLGRVSVGHSNLGLAVSRTEPLIINNLLQRQENELGQHVPISMLALPLRVQGTNIGILAMFKAKGFDQDDVRLMRVFAGQAAVAVDHAQLTRQVHEMAILEERHRLSRELHDSVNQLLYGISLYTEAATRQLEQGDTVAAQRHLLNIGESAQEALKEMRMLIFELRPSALTQMGLQASLSQRLKAVEEQLGLQPSFKWRVNIPLDSHIEEALYGITQEALNNVVRHAKAHSVTVHLVQSGQTLILKIEDDGTGFTPDQISDSGVGLKTMRERAESLGAQLNIDSAPGQGTCITVEVKLWMTTLLSARD
jgi:signal transduction histidine kinase